VNFLFRVLVKINIFLFLTSAIILTGSIVFLMWYKIKIFSIYEKLMLRNINKTFGEEILLEKLQALMISVIIN
jgi:hypothetical protein